MRVAVAALVVAHLALPPTTTVRVFARHDSVWVWRALVVLIATLVVLGGAFLLFLVLVVRIGERSVVDFGVSMVIVTRWVVTAG